MWEKEKKKVLVRDLEIIESEIRGLTGKVDGDYFSEHRKRRLVKLEVARTKIHLHKEHTL